MELTFRTSTLPFLRCAVHEVRFAEETGDIIVPDSSPDIQSIADSYAEVFLRGKDCKDGSVTIAGGIKGVILYQPEGGGYPRKLDLYIPFSVRFDHTALTQDTKIQTNMLVRSVDARVINSRKAMLRVNLACEIRAFSETSESICELETVCEDLQVRPASYIVSLPLETCEKSFVISDTLDLPKGRPEIREVYKANCKLEQTDQKLVANKMIFKGNLHCKLLYLGQDEKLHVWKWQIPYSQYCELAADYEEERADVRFVLTGCDLETDMTDGNARLSLTVNVLAQAAVCGQREWNVLEDAYATRGTLQPQWQDYSIESCLDQLRETESIRCELNCELQEIVDTEVYRDQPTVEYEDHRVKIVLPVKVSVLGYNENGELQGAGGKTEIIHTLELCDGSRCLVSSEQFGEVYSNLVPGGAEVRCSVALSVTCCTNQALKTLCGGEIVLDEEPERRPSVVVRMAGSGTGLWELAKRYKTTVYKISEANHLENDCLSHDQLLLIPLR